MPRHGVTIATLNGFLGRFCSRYSNWDGYWLFGFLLHDECRLDWELWPLEAPPTHHVSNPTAYAQELAIKTFGDQAIKNRADRRLKTARLSIIKHPEQLEVWHGPNERGLANTVVVMIEATDVHGRCFRRSKQISVAKHDPAKESQSHPT